jgi:serine/threonine protein phosphatase PrpC
MSDAQEDKSELGGSDTQVPPAAAPTVAPEELPHTPWTPGQGLCVRYAGRSAVGLVREHNEDNFVIANLTTGEVSPREASLIDVVGEGGLLFAVCDGMGGAAAGEVASQMAVEVLHEAMRRGGFPRERDELARRLVSAVEEAGRRIFDSAQKERSRRGMGTTATVAVLVDKVLFLAEVGDSRAYMLRAGSLKQLTKDQSSSCARAIA